MLNSEGVEEYWQQQTEKGDNPCHYHNKWQDRYAFEVRTRAFKNKDFERVTKVVDVGCGIAEYTTEIAKLTSAHFDAFDFPFNIEIAEKKYGDNPHITFHPNAVPHESIREAVKGADRVITTTVYVHFSEEARTAFYSYVSEMKPGSRVMLLEYIPDVIPDFQKGLAHKQVETWGEIEKRFMTAGFTLHTLRHVNFVDSLIFHYLGTNAIAYYLTRGIETILHAVGYTRSKYKVLIFEKK